MGKLLGACACVLLVGMMPHQPPAPPGPTIKIDPSPAHQGQKITITYTGGALPVTLNLDWDPAGTPTSVTITSDAGAEVMVPANATSLIVTGGMASAATTCGP